MDGRRILISPLNWGFGHAGRMIPLALELKKRGHEIIFGADKSLIQVLEKDLINIPIIPGPGISIRYSRVLPQYLCIFIQVPLIIISAFCEYSALKRIVRELKPDIIISDNRFGFFHKDVYSVFVTHQLRIAFPRLLRFLEPVAVWLNRQIIAKYDVCLIPDYPGNENLSGMLSHDVKLPENVFYMGPLSRFTIADKGETYMNLPPRYYCLILSGPEPQRSLFYEKVSIALHGIQLVVLSGTPLICDLKDRHDITLITNPDTATMRHVIRESAMVISRAGYTSIMELVSLGRGGVIIPTPGQTEQEYLGQYNNGHYGFVTLKQNNLVGLNEACQNAEVPASDGIPDSRALFEEAVRLLLDQKEK
jgi:uncharacterized protein (TIGR00661 family)